MFFQKAQEGNNQVWRYVIVMLAIIAGYIIGQLPMLLAIWRSISENPELSMSALEDFGNDGDFSRFGINKNMGLTLLLMMFLGAFAVLFFIIKPVHQREFRTLITPSSRINWSRIFFGFFTWLTISLAIEAVAYGLSPSDYILQFNLSSFIPLLIIAVLLLPIQTSTEEFIFRGYLMQGIANSSILRKRNLNYKFTALIITSLLFGLVHSMNPEIQEFGFGIMQSYYVSAGLFLGILTIMDDGLELALGVHAATNFTGAVFVGYQGAAIQTDAIFVTKSLNPNYMLIAFILMAVLFLLICKKKFGWSAFSKIFEKVEKKETELV